MAVIFVKRNFVVGLVAGLAVMFLAGQYFFYRNTIQVLIITVI